MKLNSVSFGSTYVIQGKNIDMENPDHMCALGGATGIARNGRDLFADIYMNDDIQKSKFVFDVPDKEDSAFEKLLKTANLKFTKRR